MSRHHRRSRRSRSASSSSDSSSSSHHRTSHHRSRSSRSSRRSRRSRSPRTNHTSRDSKRPPLKSSRAPKSPKSPAILALKPSEPSKSQEVALSIEETNALRLQLGLKPLQGKKSSEVNLQKSKQQIDLETDANRIQKALERSKLQRQVADAIKGESLGEMISKTRGPTQNVRDWVQKTREAADHAASEKNETSDGKYVVSELKVGHAMDRIEAGEEVILTLKDNYLLDAGQLNEAEDELINVGLSEQDRMEEKAAQAQRASRAVYTGYDDEEFLPNNLLRKDKPKILAQYDEQDQIAMEREKRTFRLDTSGTALDTTVKKTLETSEKVENEVITLACFRTKPHKKKKSRRMCNDDKEDVSDLIKQLEAQASQRDSGHDRRKRDVQKAEIMGEMEEDEKLRRFQRAQESENTIAKKAFQRSKRKVEVDAAMVDAEDYNLELSACVARTKEWMSREHASSKTKEGVEIMISQQLPVHSGNVFKADGALSSVVFNEATDFETRLKNALLQQSASRDLEEIKETATPSVSESDTKNQTQIHTQTQVEAPKMETEKKAWGEEQPLIGSGVAATLALLRKTGNLQETKTERQAGRPNDARDRNISEQLHIKDGVNLDYRDEFGRLLTKKEAFRLLSYKFHGHEPGKKRKEKRLRQLKDEIVTQKRLSGEGSTEIMKMLQRKQKQAKQAHVMLS